MKTLLTGIFLIVLSLFILSASTKDKRKIGKVHAVTDLAHEFSFYADHRFHTQYLKGHKGATNWCSLYHFDFSNANLLILLGCDDHISYVPQDIETIHSFLDAGGGVVLLGRHTGKSQNDLANRFGANFKGKAEQPLKPGKNQIGITTIEGGEGCYLELQEPSKWKVLINDASGRPVLAQRRFRHGQLLIGSRSLAGSNPNAKDSINVRMWKPLLVSLASGKTIDENKPFKSKGIDELEYTEQREFFTLRYNDYLKPYAKAMIDISERCIPFIEKRMGVPLSTGMGSEIALLATGGGGFSSGKTIALAVWWGGFPTREDSMIEFITHESVHSWVLPYAEVWNEPIATYVGNLVMIDMGYPEEGTRRINAQIAMGKKHDPEMNIYDLNGISSKDGTRLEGNANRDIHWGKTYWIFEQLRQQYPDFLSRYFKTKRKVTTEQKITKYDINNTVAVMSIAIGHNLFPWFKEHGISVDRTKSEIKF